MRAVYGDEKTREVMTIEIVSPIYEDVSIESWAQVVRDIKIRELKNIIKEKTRILDDVAAR